jgi:hypothetical protein
MLQHIIGVFKLDSKTFDTIEKDTSLTGQAALIVVVVSLISALGNGFLALFRDNSFTAGFFSSLVAVLLGWLLWSAMIWFIGTRFFTGQASLGEMLRVIGFAYAPQVLSIIPCIGGVAGAVWTLAAGFVAVRQGLELDNLKAAITIVLGFVCYLILLGIVNTLIF